jgi:hypothetical protein
MLMFVKSWNSLKHKRCWFYLKQKIKLNCHIFSISATSEKIPTIKQLYFKLYGPSNNLKVVDKALNKTLFWTKDVIWSTISFEASANYVPEIDSLNKPNYITGYHIGIEELKIHLTLSRGK